MDAVAPGGRFVVTTAGGPSGYYRVTNCSYNATPGVNTGFGGTSAAAPVVSGVAGLLLGRFSLVGDELEHVIEVTASRSRFPQITGLPDNQYGWGLVNADSALKYISAPRVLTRGILLGDSLKALQLRQTGYNAAKMWVEDSAAVSIYFDSTPDIPYWPAPCMRYRLRGQAVFQPSFTALPDVWVRGSGSLGASDSVHYDTDTVVPWGRVLTRSNTAATFESFVYRVLDYGWVPAPPVDAAIAWSAAGPAPGAVAVEDTPGPRVFAVRATPNPVSGSALVQLDLAKRGLTTVSVIDLSGRVIARLVSGVLGEGSHQLRWDGRAAEGHPCPAGVYFVRAEQGGLGLTQKLVLLQGARR